LTQYVVDTSVAVPLLVASHEAHDIVRAWAQGKTLGIAGHALVETYSVLTRLPGDARVTAPDAVRLIDENFHAPVGLSPDQAGQVHGLLAPLGIVGGATYDGLVALAAKEHDAVLVTRDARARGTYEAVGARVAIIVASQEK